MISIVIQPNEMSVLYYARRMEGDRGGSNAITSEFHCAWERRRNESSKGRWIHRFIPNISIWLERKYVETNYRIIQFQMENSAFYRQHLHRVRVDDSPNFPMCSGTPEDGECVIFHCPRLAMKRRNLN